MKQALANGLRWAARAWVMATAAGIMVLTLMQQSGGPDDVWTELSRYLPYYWLALPCIVALVLSWFLGWRWLAGSAAVAAWLAVVTLGWVFNFGEHAAPAGTVKLRFMTYNVKAVIANELAGGMAALDFEVNKHQPDVIVMQDANGLFVPRGSGAVSEGLKVFGLPYAFVLGQYAVASRHPLRDCAEMKTSVDDFRPVRCTLRVAGTDVSIVTAHFLSPRGGLMAARREGIDGADDWQRNYAQRLQQANALLRAVAELPRPLIVAGDLNAPESSPVIQTLLTAGLRDAFAAGGWGYGFTYGQAFTQGIGRGRAFLRIDHILVSGDLHVSRTWIGGGGASQHQPVVADLALRAASAPP
jgi:endonuclease/exonuclease/phosphatase (EEP) superfamily protein YafD